MGVDRIVSELSGKIRIDTVKVGEEIEKIMEGEHGESIGDRILSYSNVLKGSQWTATQYLKAVEFVTYRLMGLSQLVSWQKTFPERTDKPDGTQRASSSIYEQGQLVQKLLAQSQIPLHVFMMNERVRAAQVLSELMVHSDNERIQMESADKLLNHVKLPETLKIEMDIGIAADDTIKNIDASLTKLAALAQTKISEKTITPKQLVERNTNE